MLTTATNQFFPFHREAIDVEDRESVVTDNDKDENVDHGEADSGFNDGDFEDFCDDGLMVKIGDGSNEFEVIKDSFIKGMGIHAKETDVMAIYKNLVSSPAIKARWHSFQIFAQAVAEKLGGNSNTMVGWYGGSKEELCHIISYGFNRCGGTDNDGSHGHGIHLSPAKFPMDSVKSAVVDRSGLSHMLLCRVIMGKMEMVPAGSKQFQPSSTEFDSGVDNLAEPRKLIVWNAFMNSHIFPSYIISFKPPILNGRNQVKPLRPNSPWMSFTALIDILFKLLDRSKMSLIWKSYSEFRKSRISRLQLIQKVRQISGDRLLVEIIKSHKHKLLCRPTRHTDRN